MLPKVTECSHSNSPTSGFVHQWSQPGHPNLNMVGFYWFYWFALKYKLWLSLQPNRLIIWGSRLDCNSHISLTDDEEELDQKTELEDPVGNADISVTFGKTALCDSIDPFQCSHKWAATQLGNSVWGQHWALTFSKWVLTTSKWCLNHHDCFSN